MATQYAQVSDLNDLSAFPISFKVFQPSELNASLLSASEYVDSFLRSKYQLPLTAWGSDIILAVCSIAAYRLYAKRGFNPDAPGDAVIRQAYDDALAWLKLISKGEAAPDVTDSTGGQVEPGQPVGEAEVITSSQRGWSSRGRRPGPFGGFVGD